ncbi:MAG: L,D-transpeptidase family protein [Beijerinckiaceae bacterium]
MRIRTGLFSFVMMSLATLGSANASADDPVFGPGTYDRTRGGLQFYEDIVAGGGWGTLPAAAANLKEGASSPLVGALRMRLAISGDLGREALSGDVFDASLVQGLKRFQARHGLTETGSVGTLTLKALNVPAKTRLMQLKATMERMRNNGFQFPQRYVVVNIPSASVEAINNGRVERRHVAVVGRKDRPSPVLETRITAVNLNPTWTAPLSIVKNDIMPKVRANPGFLAASNMRIIGAGGEELPVSAVDWSGKTGVNFSIRQDPGPTNALGVLRLDMPNSHAVYMHDTPKKELFRSDLRFHSSGCARTANVRDLAIWLAQGTGLTRDALDAAVEEGDTKTVRLAKPVAVAWVYLTAWGDGLGNVQFREDIYGLDDTTKEIAASTLVARRAPAGTTASVTPRQAPLKLSQSALDAR